MQEKVPQSRECYGLDTEKIHSYKIWPFGSPRRYFSLGVSPLKMVLISIFLIQALLLPQVGASNATHLMERDSNDDAVWNCFE